MTQRGADARERFFEGGIGGRGIGGRGVGVVFVRRASAIGVLIWPALIGREGCIGHGDGSVNAGESLSRRSFMPRVRLTRTEPCVSPRRRAISGPDSCSMRRSASVS
jgi:hypothetical protein